MSQKNADPNIMFHDQGYAPGNLGLSLQHQFALSPEDVSDLSQLIESRAWQVYKKILIRSKEGYKLSLLPMKDTDQIMKTLGVVVGINFAVNQLGVLVAQIKKQQANTLKEESKNPSLPEG